MQMYMERGQSRHAFEAFSDDLKKDNIRNLLFLRGSEQYLVTWACDMLIKKYVNKVTESLDLVRFDPGNFTVQAMMEACETLPVMSARKLVILDNFYYIWGKAPREAFDDAKKKQFLEYIKKLPDSTVLVVASPEPEDSTLQKYGNAMSKGVSSAGKVYKFDPLQENQLLGFIKKRLIAGGKTASRRTMEMLVAESGYYNKEIDYGLFNLDNDLKKIMALSADEEVTPQDVERGVSDNLEHNTFKMWDSICSNKKDEAFRLIRELLLTGHREFQLLAGIAGQIELMLEVKEMHSLGMTLPQIKSILNIHEYRIKKAMGFASGYTADQLKSMLKMAYQTEKTIKSGLLKGEMALDMLIARI